MKRSQEIKENSLRINGEYPDLFSSFTFRPYPQGGFPEGEITLLAGQSYLGFVPYTFQKEFSFESEIKGNPDLIAIIEDEFAPQEISYVSETLDNLTSVALSWAIPHIVRYDENLKKYDFYISLTLIFPKNFTNLSETYTSEKLRTKFEPEIKFIPVK